jgi:hypothetical protein
MFILLGSDTCSQEAVVTSQSSKPEKQTAIIIAEEKGNARQLLLLIGVTKQFSSTFS